MLTLAHVLPPCRMTVSALPPAQPVTVIGHHPAHRPGAPWRHLLSELNPLQYLPVIGTVYRAVTGDEISDTARAAGSLVVSGLLAGPVGLVTALGSWAAEKATGIDPERIGRAVLARIGIGAPLPPEGPSAIAGVRLAQRAPNPEASDTLTQQAGLIDPPLAEPPPQSFTAAQRRAYQAHADTDADTLNGRELARIEAEPGFATHYA